MNWYKSAFTKVYSGRELASIISEALNALPFILILAIIVL